MIIRDKTAAGIAIAAIISGLTGFVIWIVMSEIETRSNKAKEKR